MKLAITGGGTGGHLAIAVALAKEARSRGIETIFIGSSSGQDRDYFGDGGHYEDLFSEAYFLPTSGVVNKKGLARVASLFAILKATLRSIKILRSCDVLYSVGGFSAAPASFASLLVRKPLYIHEQNAVIGRLNALLKPYAKSFVSAYEDSSPIKGYPVQEIFFDLFRIRKSVECVIFLGGSLGARAINDLALSVVDDLSNRGIKIVHQTGKKDYERVVAEYKRLGVDAEVVAFSKDIASLMERADLAVSRSGASTLWELCANGLPALFVPYPYAALDHQYYNAKFLRDANLAWLEREGADLKGLFLTLLDEDLTQKSEKLASMTNKNVAKMMIDEILGDTNEIYRSF